MNMPILPQTIQVADKQTSLIQYKSVPVMTTEQLADFYGTDPVRIRQNLERNQERFIENKHCFKISGQELKDFASSLKILTNSSMEISSKARSLTLWTEKGAARHAKILDTDQAWDIFEQLEEVYFVVKEKSHLPSYAIDDPIERAKKWIEEEKQKQAAIQQLELAAPKVQYFDRVADTKNLLNASQVGKKVGMSAVKLNQYLADMGVYDRRIAGRTFAQWFIDKGYGEVKQTEQGYPQSKFTNKGEQWVIEQLVSEGVVV